MKLLISICLPLVFLLAGNGSTQVDALVDSLSLRSRSNAMHSSSKRTMNGPVALGEVSVTAPDTSVTLDALINEPRPVVTKPSTLSHLTWKRRLDTKQDPLDVHKWAGFGWWVSATAIFGTGTLSGFTQVPPVLEAYTYLFLLATLAQGATSVPMAIKFRPNEPDVQRGFISSAITSSSMAIVGVWLSPFGESAILSPSIVASLIGFIIVTDILYSLTSFEDIKMMIQEFKDKKIDQAKFITTIPWALPLNLILLHEMVHHASDMRQYFVATIVSNGSSIDLVYYASMVTSIFISVGNLTSTLHHRKLISKEVMDIAFIGSQVVTIVFNLKAAGLY
ncbi:expressed unknown protein [Seminavis robusta]|uniref:Uncharacterized protein n=1 Tax=Seminavis robusta TaxID=568900 RepID=A0A9N8DWX2_9STRA|nr:expressed unknown protein [Seminavis robusta]|eukprot:Sro437_g142890.1 n/a (336) ;mRNA; r:51677-52684